MIRDKYIGHHKMQSHCNREHWDIKNLARSAIVFPRRSLGGIYVDELVETSKIIGNSGISVGQSCGRAAESNTKAQEELRSAIIHGAR